MFFLAYFRVQSDFFFFWLEYKKCLILLERGKYAFLLFFFFANVILHDDAAEMGSKKAETENL